LGALFHRASFLVRESFELLVVRGVLLADFFASFIAGLPPLGVLMEAILMLESRCGGGFFETDPV
jgi:hypothetical protein